MSNLSISQAAPVQSLPQSPAKPDAPAAPSAPAKQSGISAADTLKLSSDKKIQLPSLAAGVVAGAIASSAMNAFTAADHVKNTALQNPLGAIFVGKAGLRELTAEITRTRALWGAGVGALAGALVATQTDSKMAALGAGVFAGGVAACFLNRTPEGVARYVVVGAVGGLAASFASSALKK